MRGGWGSDSPCGLAARFVQREGNRRRTAVEEDTQALEQLLVLVRERVEARLDLPVAQPHPGLVRVQQHQAAGQHDAEDGRPAAELVQLAALEAEAQHLAGLDRDHAGDEAGGRLEQPLCQDLVVQLLDGPRQQLHEQIELLDRTTQPCLQTFDVHGSSFLFGRGWDT